LLALLSFGAASLAPGDSAGSGTPAPERKWSWNGLIKFVDWRGRFSGLNPFDVITSKDRGFVATNAGTRPKLGLDMKDMAAPIP